MVVVFFLNGHLTRWRI